jgi:hypothetical protein
MNTACPVKLCTDTMQVIIPEVSSHLSQPGDMDFQPLVNARREYVHAGDGFAQWLEIHC